MATGCGTNLTTPFPRTGDQTSARQLQNLCGDHWHHGCGRTFFLFLSAPPSQYSPFPDSKVCDVVYTRLLFWVAIIDFQSKLFAATLPTLLIAQTDH